MAITIEMAKKVEAEFPIMVANLKKSPDVILTTLTPEKCDLIHMVFGICGEVGELVDAETPEHFKEEMGDLIFYIEGLFQIPCIKAIAATAEDLMSSVLHPDQNLILDKIDKKGLNHCLHYYSAELLDAIKKHVIYCKELDTDKVSFNLAAILTCMAELGVAHKVGLTAAKMANLDKLLKGKNARYASGSYSDQQAQARADKIVGAEAKIVITDDVDTSSEDHY